MLKSTNCRKFLLLSSACVLLTACEDTEARKLSNIEDLKAREYAIVQANHNSIITNLQEVSQIQSESLPLAQAIAHLPKDNPIARFASDSIENLLKVDSTILTEKTTIVVDNASMLISVREYDIAKQKVHNYAAQFEAIVVSEKEELHQYKIANTFTIQVPTQNYAKLLEAFKEMAMVLREKTTWKEDLSVNWADVYARLESKHLAQQKLQDLLKKASHANEILPIQKELESLQEEMQVLNRIAQTLQQKTLYSSIVLTIYQEINTQPMQVAGFGERVTENALKGWAHFKNTVITLATYWVYLSIGFVILTIVFFAKRKASKNIQAEDNQAPWNN